MKKWVILLGLFLAVGGYWLTVEKKKTSTIVDKDQVLSATSNRDYVVVTKEFGTVEVTLEPRQLKSGMKMIFSMSIDTHSGDLGYDWTKQVKIKDDLGNEYKAIEWTGETGGHHLGGDLVFEPLNENVQEVVLTITGVDDTSNNFVWKVE